MSTKRSVPAGVVAHALDRVVLPDLHRIFLWASLERWRKEAESVPWVPCGMYGCETLRRQNRVMCADCFAEQKEDPDAFK